MMASLRRTWKAFVCAAFLSACAAPAVRERPLEQAVAEGVDFLVRSQNPDGSWGSARGTTGFDVWASPPGSFDGFRGGTTALCVMALREAGEREASARGLEWLIGADHVRRATPDMIYNVWAHTYALEALSRALAEEPASEKIRSAARRELDLLERYETATGGWNYYDFHVKARTPAMEPTSFGTAAGLGALFAAKQAGLPVPEPLIRRALSRMRESRNPDGSFLYGTNHRLRPTHLANRDKGSLGRAQAGHFALSTWNAPGIGEPEIRAGLDRFFRDHRFLDMGRKRQFPHEAWYYTSGYYYYFGHYYAARLIERLADPGDYRKKLRACILPYQEPEGSWWDYAMYDYHKPYGTAFAIMTLLRCSEK